VTSSHEPEDFTIDEQKGIDALLASASISVNNTVIYREATRYNVKTLSIAVDEVGRQIGEFNGLPVFVTKGRHSAPLQKVNHSLALARDSALNPVEAEALSHLIAHNETGDIAEHITYSELWVRDGDPIVEAYLGVIESYRDPSGTRCEWEGIVASIDPAESKFLHEFVERSSTILPLLPYPPVYERPNFVPPSYNAINVLTFCVSGMPVGINIPNYDEIRLKKGFKNVSLSNVLPAVTPIKFPFLTDEALPSFLEDDVEGRKLQIAAHELYGHGSGTLFTKADVDAGIPDLLNPARRVSTYYAEGETFQSVFGSVGPSFEECRAEATALHLIYKDDVLALFGIAPEKRLQFKVNSTLTMLHNGLSTLTCYQPEVAQWKQAHARARFAILRAVLMWGRGAVAVKRVQTEFKLEIDVQKFDGVVDAVENLLKHLNYFKAARLPDQAREFFGALTALDDFWTEVRAQAVAIRLPKPIVCGATVRSGANGLRLTGPAKSVLTTLDVALSIVENVRIASG
jgi:dipeptidyl-peptidase-3